MVSIILICCLNAACSTLSGHIMTGQRQSINVNHINYWTRYLDTTEIRTDVKGLTSLDFYLIIFTEKKKKKKKKTILFLKQTGTIVSKVLSLTVN